MRTKDRLDLIFEIAARFDSVGWEDQDIILNAYGVVRLETGNDPFGTEYESVKSALQKASDETLFDLAEHFDLDLTRFSRAPRIAGAGAQSGPLILFASHVSAHRREVHAVAGELSKFNIELFVAHDSISVDEPWRDEIEKSLNTSHAGVLFLHPTFNTSVWCQQETGWMLGRGLPVLRLLKGETPAGFANTLQGAELGARTPADIAEMIAQWAVRKPQLAPNAGESLVHAMRNSTSFNQTDSIWHHLRELTKLNGPQCTVLMEAARHNTQVYRIGAKEGPERGTPYPQVICEFIRQQPGFHATSAQVEQFESELAKSE
ncbi:toll/interleukin-1 receptor domain-containing protein [Dietzia sp. MNB45]|uniref:toll/interleukin-1 receptor domain-containing protein n=1 Tax=Dietzia sp. MNB45 TaxID=3238800 RepID=UPI003F7EE733